MLNAPQSQPKAPKLPSETKKAAARKLADVYFSEDTMKDTSGIMAKNTCKEIGAGHPIPAEVERKLHSDMNEIMRVLLQDANKEKLSSKIMDIYEEDEIEAYLAFFASPLGKRIFAKTFAISQGVSELTESILKEHQKEMQTAIEKATQGIPRNAIPGMNPILFMMMRTETRRNALPPLTPPPAPTAPTPPSSDATDEGKSTHKKRKGV